MTSPFRRHIEKTIAMQATHESLHLDAYQKLFMRLKKAQKQLKEIQSIDNKALFKADLLPDFQAWVDGVLENPTPNTKDEIFTTILVWHIDAGLLDAATTLSMFAIKHQFAGLDDFQRTLATTIFEEIAVQLSKGEAITLDNLESLSQCLEQKQASGAWLLDMPDKVRAKFFKEAANIHDKLSNKARALDLYHKALFCDERIGVKAQIKRLEK